MEDEVVGAVINGNNLRRKRMKNMLRDQKVPQKVPDADNLFGRLLDQKYGLEKALERLKGIRSFMEGSGESGNEAEAPDRTETILSVACDLRECLVGVHDELDKLETMIGVAPSQVGQPILRKVR